MPHRIYHKLGKILHKSPQLSRPSSVLFKSRFFYSSYFSSPSFRVRLVAFSISLYTLDSFLWGDLQKAWLTTRPRSFCIRIIFMQSLTRIVQALLLLALALAFYAQTDTGYADNGDYARAMTRFVTGPVGIAQNWPDPVKEPAMWSQRFFRYWIPYWNLNPQGIDLSSTGASANSSAMVLWLLGVLLYLELCFLLHLAANGNTNPENGVRLSISSRTVESHRANLMRKLGLRSQTSSSTMLCSGESSPKSMRAHTWALCATIR